MSEPTLYEAVYIIDPSLADDEAEELITSLEEAVEAADGEVVGTRDFRTRRLAYRIGRYTHGTYKLLYFYGDGEIVEAIRGEMAIRQPIIRSRVLVANPRAIVGGVEDEEEPGAEPAREAEEAESAEAAASTEADETA
ncbi:MAG: 30S ribosomal protein S6, partial [Armatimonadota bacterium]|nr:30S ribosomal protein S6 [Armatimonadota bacterium]